MINNEKMFHVEHFQLKFPKLGYEKTNSKQKQYYPANRDGRLRESVSTKMIKRIDL